MRILPFGVLVLVAVFAAACGGGGGGPSLSPTRPPTVTLPPTLEPSISPTPSPTPGIDLPPVPAELASQYRLVFYRDPVQRYPAVGRLWTANLDGSAARPLTSPGRDLLFAGMPDDNTLYAVDFTGELTRSLVRIDLATGQSAELATFDATYEWGTYAAMSPDGRLIAYGGGESTNLLDVATGASSALLEGSYAGCNPLPTGPPTNIPCFVYRDLSWAPDSSLLAVGKVYYEGGNPVIVAPDVPGVETVIGLDVLLAYGSMAWSPDSGGLCVHGRYDAPSGLYVSRGPDWANPERYLAEYEATQQFEKSVIACGWLSRSEVLVATMDGTGGLTIGTLDLPSGTLTEIGLPTQRDTGANTEFISLGGDYMLMQPFDGEKNEVLEGYPIVINTATGEAYAALTRDDIVVNVLAAD